MNHESTAKNDSEGELPPSSAKAPVSVPKPRSSRRRPTSEQDNERWGEEARYERAVASSSAAAEQEDARKALRR